MLENLFFGLFGLAVFLCALTAIDDEEIGWPILSFPFWIILAVCVGSLERPYAFLTAEGTVVEYVLSYSGGAYLMYLFLGMAIVFIVILWNRVQEMWVERAKKNIPKT